MVNEYQATPGLLMFLLGNENNYGLFWRGAETENIPMQDRRSTKDAQHLYKLFNDAAKEMKAISQSHPLPFATATCFSWTSLPGSVRISMCWVSTPTGALRSPICSIGPKRRSTNRLCFTEFGSDAYNTKANKEDQNTRPGYWLATGKKFTPTRRHGKTETHWVALPSSSAMAGGKQGKPRTLMSTTLPHPGRMADT